MTTVSTWIRRSGGNLGAPISRRFNELLGELRAVRSEITLLRNDIGSAAEGGATPRACPICRTTFRDFVPFKNRPKASCPKCGSLERHRLSWLYLQHETRLFVEPTRMLHFAPEDCMKKRLKGYFNIDYVEASYDPEKPEEGIDIQRLPYPDASYDLIYCSHVLEHVPDDRRAMAECARVLRPNGVAIIMVPTRNTAATYEDATITSPEARTKHFGRWDHLRWYGRDVVSRLAEAGFDVSIDYHADAISIEDQWKFGVASEPIFTCRKST